MLAPRNPAAGAARKRIALGALVAACLAFSAPDAGASSRRALAGPVAFAGRVTGLVRDKATGEELIGATVQVKGTAIGIATDVDGRFSLPSVPSGAQTLVVSYIGYRQQEVAVNVVDGGTVQVTVDLEPSSLQGDEVTVTAQVEGQVAAINQQIASNTISNVVSAARIQELPDVNAAESIGRVPGVSIQRSGGEANRIVIRGLSPKYATVTVNGVRLPSSGGDDRSVDLSLISPNTLAGIEVTKALTADRDADAIAGSVDLRLREAPAGFEVDALAQGGYTQLQDTYGNYKFAGSLSNRFFGERLGVIATVNADRYDRSVDRFGGGYGQLQSSKNPGEFLIQLNRVSLREEQVERARAGGSALLDYRIPLGKITGNVFYNRLRNDALNRDNGLYNSTNSRHTYSVSQSENTTSIWTGALSGEQDFGWFRYDAGVSRTASRARNPLDYVWDFAQEGNAYTTFENTPGMDPRSIVPFITPSDSTTALANVYYNSTDRDENQAAFQLNATLPYRFGRFVTGYLKTGGKLRWLDRLNDEGQRGRNGMQYGVTRGSGVATWFQCVSEKLPEGLRGYDVYETALRFGLLPIRAFDTKSARPGFLEGDYPLGFTVDEATARAFSEALDACGVFQEQVVASRGRDYTGVERYQAGYVMSEINLGRYVTFMPGIRWEGDYSRYVGQQYRELVVNNQQAAPTDLDTLTSVRKNAFWLPMVHLRIKPLAWLDLRLAYTESIARPDYIQYVPITRIDSQQQYAFAGNTALRPTHATNYDASLSVYHNRVGLFTVSGFRKTLKDNIIYQQFFTSNGAPPAGLNIPEEWLVNNPRVDTYVNNPYDATYKGFELDWQTNFWYLPSVLRGLVLNMNYTRLFSSASYEYFGQERRCTNCPSPRPKYENVITTAVREGRVTDQPAHVANVTVGYDIKGFSTRLSYLYQTDRLSGVENPAKKVLDAYTGAYGRYDLAVRQKLRLGLEVFANFNNLTSTADRGFLGSASGVSPTSIEYYGFTMDLGARYRF